MAVSTILDANGEPIQSRATPENPTFDLNSPEAWEYLGGTPSSSGVTVSRQTALGYAPYWRGVNMIARDIGKLPFTVYRRVDRGKQRDTDHPAYRLLLYEPNQYMDSMKWRQTIMGHVLTEGNGYSYIMRNGDGSPAEILPLSPDCTYPLRVNGTLWYVTTVQGSMRKLEASNIIHIAGLGFDGLIGYSVIDYARESLGLGMAARDYGSRFFSGGATPAIVLEHPGAISKEKAALLKNSWESMHKGIGNAHRTAVLEEGMKVSKLSANAKESQLAELRIDQILEVANILGIPPHKLGYMQAQGYNSRESDNQSYLDDALDGWLCAWEHEARRKLLTEAEKLADTHVIEFNRRSLVRADIGARYAAYRTGRDGGWLSVNDIRAAENENTIEGGDEYLVPLNMRPADEPSAESDNDPPPGPPSNDDANDKIDDGADDRAARARLLVDTFARMTRRICTQLRRAKSVEDTAHALEQLDMEHGRTVLEALGITLAVAANGADPAAMRDRLFERVREAVRVSTDRDATLNAIERELPGVMTADAMEAIQ